jgi:hypothetical protein
LVFKIDVTVRMHPMELSDAKESALNALVRRYGLLAAWLTRFNRVAEAARRPDPSRAPTPARVATPSTVIKLAGPE